MPSLAAPDRRWAATPLTALCALLLMLGAACSPKFDEGAEEASRGRPATAAGDTAAAEAAGHKAAEHEGAEHEDGDRVTLSEAALETAQIRVEPVARVAEGAASSAALGEPLEAPGQVGFEPQRVAVISPRVAGRVERLTVADGDRVRAGQTVALLYSPAYLTAQNDFVQATRRATALAGTADSTGATVIAQAATRRLELLGVSAVAIRRLAETGEVSAYLPLAAPFGGSIMESQTLPGAAVEAGTPVFKLADLSVVDILADVPERAIRFVRVGQTATIRVAAYPDETFTGRVERLHDELNPETRTVHAVIHVPNPARRMRPGMFATVRLDVPAMAAASGPPHATPALLTIPESALVSEGETRYAFVEVGPRTFERRQVRVASLAPPGSATVPSGRVAVREGLAAGERVVVQGAFTLKSELAKASLAGEGH